MLSKKFRNILVFGCIAAIFAAVGYWNISPERFLDQPVAKVDESAIDYYALNAHSVQYLPDGKLQYEMTSDKAEHLKATDVTLVTKPDLNMFRGTEFPWHVTSEHAEVNSGWHPGRADRLGAHHPFRREKPQDPDYHHPHDSVPATAICADRSTR